MAVKAGKVKYKLIIWTEKGERLDITQAATNIGWQENQEELSSKLTFTLRNTKYNKRLLSDQIGIGCPVLIWADWGSGKGYVAGGTIRKAVRDTKVSSSSYDVTAYDNLYPMQKSQDNVYYTAGKKTKAIITELMAKWGVEIGKYDGPDVAHGAVVYKSKPLGDIVRGVLDEAVKKGGVKSIPRSTVEGKVDIFRIGSNEEVFIFNDYNSVQATHEKSIENLLTRVVIVTSGKGDEQPSVQAVVDGHTEFGVLQKIKTSSSSETLDDAKKEAEEELHDKGEPIDSRTVISPDVPPVRKGDLVLVESGRLTGRYIVKGIQHNAAKGTMTMQIEKKQGGANG